MFYEAREDLLTVLVEQHPDGYPAHVETIQEILNVLADDRVRAVGLLVLDDSLSHGGNDIIVSISDFYHRVCETKQKTRRLQRSMQNKTDPVVCKVFIHSLVCHFFTVRVFVFELENFLKTLHVPAGGKKTVITIYSQALV